MVAKSHLRLPPRSPPAKNGELTRGFQRREGIWNQVSFQIPALHTPSGAVAGRGLLALSLRLLICKMGL